MTRPHDEHVSMRSPVKVVPSTPEDDGGGTSAWAENGGEDREAGASSSYNNELETIDEDEEGERAHGCAVM